MPAPSNSNGGSLGRPVIDLSLIQDQGVRICFERLMETLIGMGWPCGAREGDAVYQAVYAQPDGGGGHILYGGKPTDPLNPDVLTVSSSGSATVIWQEEGSTVATYGTVSFVGANVTVTDGGTKAIVTITGGGGGGTYTEGNGIDIDGSNVVSAELATNRGLEFDGSGLAVSIGNGLEMSTNDIVVKPHTYIDVTSSGVAVDFTEVASYNGAGDQYLRNNAGTFQWDTLPSSGAPVAGTYIDVSGSTVSVDLTEVSGYNGATTQLLGHTSGTFQFKTVAEWINTLAGYSSGSDQSIGHDASGATEWQNDGVC